MSRLSRPVLAGLVVASLAPAGTAAAEPIRVGMLLTLSGPPAALGQQARDGFMLAMEELGGELGGVEAEVLVEDIELKPDVAQTKARALIERDAVDVVVGTIFSNMLQAIFKPVIESDRVLLSPNAGPSAFAGRNCHPHFFAVSYQNDQNHEVLGRYAEDAGMASVVLLAPNYQAGRDSLAGFKRHYTGTIADEVYVPLGHQDFSAEIARIAAADPQALFTFMPGGMGVRLVKQFRQAGLADDVTFLSAFTVDETTLPAQGADARGFFGGGVWAPDVDNDASRAFVAAFDARYDYLPGVYAMFGYDTAMLLDSAVAAVEGDLADTDAFAAAVAAADFTSLRGDFRFNNNHFPVQDFYLLEVAERDDGRFQTTIAAKVFDDDADAYHADCGME
ncbi:MAG: ABC transporter substrate-binding protein [Alphaproteobacteria bacterium]